MGYFGNFSKKFIKSNFIPFQSSQFRRERKFEILRLHLGVHKGMEWKGMYLSKGNE